jgi:hypothetical protein
MAGRVRHGLSRRATARQGRQVVSGTGGFGWAECGRAVEAWCGSYGLVGRGGYGKAGEAWFVRLRCVLAGPGTARPGRRGVVRLVLVWLGRRVMASLGMSRNGKVWQSGFVGLWYGQASSV